MISGQSSQKAGARVNEIDLLRFLAALAVVFYHYSFRGYVSDGMSAMPYPLLAPVSKYGYLGVELFFMISGFVILMTASKGRMRGFVISRVVRLYPAFWACCTITFAVTLAIGEPRFSASLGQYLVNMTMLSGFVGVESIDGAYWSLFVEIGFYMLVGLVMILGRIHQAQSFIILWLVASLALEIFQVSILRYLLITQYAAFFIAGATYYFIWSKGLSPTRIGIVVVSWWLAMYQSIGELVDFEEDYNTPISGYIVAAIITVFFAVMMLVSLGRTGWFGRRRWMLAGALTYPLYLLHQHIGFMIFNVAYPQVNPHVLLWGAIAGALLSAYAVHVLVERRFCPPMKGALERFADSVEGGRTGRAESRRRDLGGAKGILASLPGCGGGAGELWGDGRGTNGILLEGHPDKASPEGSGGGG